MKKLMIAAAAAAMIGGAFADAQVYEYKLNLTTTKCASGKATRNTYWTTQAGYDAGDAVTYRVKTSLVVQGVTWGCYCPESLAGTWGTVCGNGNSSFGIVFWSKTADSFLVDQYDDTKFEWAFLNRIGKKGNEVEFALNLLPNDEAEISSEVVGDEFALTLAGMGKLNGSACGEYIKSAKGSVAGYIVPDVTVCTYCTTTPCEVYEFCVDCCAHQTPFDMDDGMSVAFGTFTMKYNASASKKLKTQALITKAYSGFSKAVKAELVLAGE